MATINNSYNYSLKDWDFDKYHVDPYIHPMNVMGPHGYLICSTAPTLSSLIGPAEEALKNMQQGQAIKLDTGLVFVGGVQQFSVTPIKNSVPVPEVGSKFSYIIPGNVQITWTITKMNTDHINLLGMLYAYYLEDPLRLTDATGHVRLDYNKVLKAFMSPHPGFKPLPEHKMIAAEFVRRIKEEPLLQPGATRWAINLHSPLFNMPFGLLVVVVNNVRQLVEAFFVEGAIAQGDNMMVDANTPFTTASIQGMAVRQIPIRLSAFTPYLPGAASSTAATSEK